MNINQATVVGRLTRDPELKKLPSGVSVANLSVATSRSWSGEDGQKREVAEFHNVVVFGNSADSCAKFLRKGQLVGIEGRLQTRSWENDGKKFYRTEIIAQSVQFGPKPVKSSTAQSEQETAIDIGTGEENITSKQESAKKGVKAGGSDSIEYPTEEINPDDIPF